MEVRRFVQLLLPFLVLGSLACAGRGGLTSPPTPPEGAATPSITAEAPPAFRPAAGARLELVRLPAGQPEMTLVVEEPGAKYRVLDGAGGLLAEVKVQADRVKVRTGADRDMCKVKRKDDGLEVEDGAGTRLFRVKVQTDGDMKLTDASDRLLARVKPRSGGFRVEDAGGRVLGRAKPLDGEVAFEDEDGSEVRRLKGTSDARAAVWFNVPMLDVEVQAGLAVYLLEGI